MNTRGELLFAKAVILFEGETKEQALPILAKEYFGFSTFEFGLNFIGVGGKDKYQPFLNLAKFLNMPWYLLSDGDGNTEQDVKNQIKKIFGENYSTLFVLNNNADFEKYLIDQEFKNELIRAINKAEDDDDFFPTKYIDEHHGQNRKGGELKRYKSDVGQVLEEAINTALLDCLREGKTKYAEFIAHEISSKKDTDGKTIIPQKIKDLFLKIKTDLHL